MLLCAVSAGARVLALAGAAPRTHERLLFALALGLGVQGTLLLALSALGWMHPAALWAVVVIPALTGLGEFGAVPAALRSVRAWLDALSPFERIAVAIVGIAVGGILVTGALAPVMDWDSLMYHVQLPKLILERGVLHVPPDGMHLAFLGLFQFLYLPLLAVGADAGPALLNATMTAALGMAVAVAATGLFSRHTGVLAFIALWGSSSLLLVGTTPRVDVALVFVLFLTHLAVVRALDADAPQGTITVAALLAGVAIATKYHAIPYLAALAPFALWAIWGNQAADRERGGATAFAGQALFGALLALAVATPWLLKNQVLFGAPLYPFFAPRLVPPFIAELLGSSAHPAGVPMEIHSALGNAREKISLAALLLRPARLTVEAEGALFTRNAVFVLVPTVLLFLRDRRLLALLVPAALYLAFTLGYFAKINLRYLMPVLPVMVLCAMEGSRRVGERLGRRKFARPLLLVIALVAIFPALRVSASRLATPVRVKVALGLLPPEALLAGDLQHAVAQYMNANTPADAKILMLFEARGYYHTRSTIQDNVLTNWPLLVGTGAPDRCLAGTGITHVLVNDGAIAYYVVRGLDLSSLAWDRFPEFARRCLDPMVSANGISILRVR
ncbi:MAG: hypothetical protein ACYC0B_00850 [Gemmatimonadaceae bacterium]